MVFALLLRNVISLEGKMKAEVCSTRGPRAPLGLSESAEAFTLGLCVPSFADAGDLVRNLPDLA